MNGGGAAVSSSVQVGKSTIVEPNLGLSVSPLEN